MDVLSLELLDLGRRHLAPVTREFTIGLRAHRDDTAGERDHLTATVCHDGVDCAVTGEGNGPVEAFIDGFQKQFGLAVRIANYEEHAMGDGANARAVCFVEARVGEGPTVFGAGIHGNIVSASLAAIVSAVNRATNQKLKEERGE